MFDLEQNKNCSCFKIDYPTYWEEQIQISPWNEKITKYASVYFYTVDSSSEKWGIEQ